MLLRSAGLAPLWVVSIPGAKVDDLASAWEHAPECDLGLTIFNGNDFLGDQAWNSEFEARLRNLSLCAIRACTSKHFFFLNDPAFFPDLAGTAYPGMVKRAYDLLAYAAPPPMCHRVSEADRLVNSQRSPFSHKPQGEKRFTAGYVRLPCKRIVE
eukprot:9475344-Pyramimonas_sp.AAC.1